MKISPSFTTLLGAAGRRALGAAAACATLLGAMPAAQAALVIGSFDPAFGPSIPNLGFRGFLTVNVPDPCFALSPGLIANSSSCSVGQMTITSASVQLYNVATPGQPTLLTLNFSPASFAVSSIVTGFSGVTLQNELLGVNTGLSAPVPGTVNDLGASLINSADDVHFDGEFELGFFAVAPASQIPGNEPFYAATLNACSDPHVGPPRTCGRESDSAPALTIFQAHKTAASPVPEPMSAALVLTALAAAGAARRHARRRPASPGGAPARGAAGPGAAPGR